MRRARAASSACSGSAASSLTRTNPPLRTSVMTSRSVCGSGDLDVTDLHVQHVTLGMQPRITPTPDDKDGIRGQAGDEPGLMDGAQRCWPDIGPALHFEGVGQVCRVDLAQRLRELDQGRLQVGTKLRRVRDVQAGWQ